MSSYGWHTVPWSDVTGSRKRHVQRPFGRGVRTPEQRHAEYLAVASVIRPVLEREPRTLSQLMRITTAYETDIKGALRLLGAVATGPRGKRGGRLYVLSTTNRAEECP